MDSRKQSVVLLRGILISLVLTYALALYIELSPSGLAAEAVQYRRLVWLSNSGFSLNYALQKLGWIIGSGFGALGATLMFLRIQHGLSLLIIAAPILCAAALLGAPTSAYPDTESTVAILLWFVTGAIWGFAIAFAWLQRGLLFVDRRMFGQRQAQRDEAQRRA